MANQLVTEADEVKIARRNTFIYALSYTFGNSITTVNISIGGLAGIYLLAADKSLATAPVTGFNIGVAFGAALAAVLTRKFGRKRGFLIGLMISFIGLLFSAWALDAQSFLLFCLGGVLCGIGAGFGHQYRFGAADHGSARLKARAISWVLVGGMLASIIGSSMVIFGRDLLLPTPFAGTYLGISVMVIIAMVVMSFLIVSEPKTVLQKADVEPARSLREILLQPRLMVAVLCGTLTYALMVLVMTGAPLAMVGCGHSIDNASLGIQWHALAMFGPSFFTGRLIARFGHERIIMCGMGMLIGCALLALSGLQLWNFWLALILLGIGWNLGFIGATSMITETYRQSEKNTVQGINDFIVFATAALASMTSGIIIDRYGWDMVNYLVFPFVVVSMFALVWLMWQPRKSPLMSP